MDKLNGTQENVTKKTEPTELMNKCRLLSGANVMKMWGISRNTLHRMATCKDEGERLPSYRIRGHRRYMFDELVWWLDKHRAQK